MKPATGQSAGLFPPVAIFRHILTGGSKTLRLEATAIRGKSSPVKQQQKSIFSARHEKSALTPAF